MTQMTPDELTTMRRIICMCSNDTDKNTSSPHMITLITQMFKDAATMPSVYFVTTDDRYKPYHNMIGEESSVYLTGPMGLGLWWTPHQVDSLMELIYELIRFPKIEALRDAVAAFNMELNSLSEFNEECTQQQLLAYVTDELN